MFYIFKNFFLPNNITFKVLCVLRSNTSPNTVKQCPHQHTAIIQQLSVGDIASKYSNLLSIYFAITNTMQVNHPGNTSFLLHHFQ